MNRKGSIADVEVIVRQAHLRQDEPFAEELPTLRRTSRYRVQEDEQRETLGRLVRTTRHSLLEE
jgi:hypothetical protein